MNIVIDRPTAQSDRLDYCAVSAAMCGINPNLPEEVESGSQTVTEEQPVWKAPKFYERVFELNDIIRQIRELIGGPHSDDEGILRPTQYAVDRIAELLIEACIAFVVEKPRYGVTFPKAEVLPDLDGGIRIEWTLSKATVTLVVPPEKSRPKEYLCKRVDGVTKVEFGLFGSLIASWLKKFS